MPAHRLQLDWILRQARDYWRDSQWPSKSPLARERHRKKFLAYARQAIVLAGAETVAGYNLDNDWQAMIREIASELAGAAE